MNERENKKILKEGVFFFKTKHITYKTGIIQIKAIFCIVSLATIHKTNRTNIHITLHTYTHTHIYTLILNAHIHMGQIHLHFTHIMIILYEIKNCIDDGCGSAWEHPAKTCTVYFFPGLYTIDTNTFLYILLNPFKSIS